MADDRGDRSRVAALQFQFAGHIRDPERVPMPEGIESRRMGIYRDLFFNNIEDLLSNNFPVLRKLYPNAEWKALVRDFFVRHRAHTPLFPQLAREFLRFIETSRGEDHGDPPFLLELAHYEWVELALSIDEAEPGDEPADPDGDLLEGAPVLSPLAWPLSYRFPVHRIRPDYRPQEAPSEPTHLVVYRTADEAVHFMELNAVSARLLALIQQRPERAGVAQLRQIAGELTAADESTVIGAGARTLRELRRREILLGTRPAA